MVPSFACAINRTGKHQSKMLGISFLNCRCFFKVRKNVNECSIHWTGCLIRSQRVHLLKYPKSFEWNKKTSRANYMVWCAHNCQSFSRLPDESEPAIYFFACRYYRRSYASVCDHSFFKCAVHLWNGDCLFSIFTIRR